MEIGKLNQRIAVLENHVKKDAIGNHKAKWEEVFSLWASVTVSNTVGGAAEETNTGVTRVPYTASALKVLTMTSRALCRIIRRRTI